MGRAFLYVAIIHAGETKRLGDLVFCFGYQMWWTHKVAINDTEYGMIVPKKYSNHPNHPLVGGFNPFEKYY